jgi:phosphoglycerate dehydrogenase-like enzyme
VSVPLRVVCGSTLFPELVNRLRSELPNAVVTELALGPGDTFVAQPHDMEALTLADVIVPLRGVVDEQILSITRRCRLIQELGAGVDSVDSKAAHRRGIPVCNVPSSLSGNAESVAELALMHLIAGGRRLRSLQRRVEAEDFSVEFGGSLFGKTVCIVGYGNIGRALARLLRPFRCRIIGIKRRADGQDAARLSVWPPDRLLEALGEADFVVVAVPLTPATRSLIGDEELRACKRGSVLVNVARGGVIDEDALVAALRSRHVSAAGLDVFVTEPVAHEDPLLDEEVLATPHCAGLTDHMLNETCRLAAENIRRVTQGLRPRYRVHSTG